MAVNPHTSVLVALPSSREVDAIQVVGDYLTRVGTQAATMLLTGAAPPQADLLAELSDTMLAGAALCAGLLDLVDVADPS